MSGRPNAVSLHRVSTVDALASALREQVLDGTLPGGTALRETELCETFGVSRHTVRTALQTLAHEGVVRQSPNRGAHVPAVTPDDVHDLFLLREILELQMVRELAGDAPRLAPAHAALDELRHLGHADRREIRDAELRFHQSLVDALESERISRTYASLMAELRLCFSQIPAEPTDHGDIVRQHERILELLDQGDADGGVGYLREHLDDSRDQIATAFERIVAAKP